MFDWKVNKLTNVSSFRGKERDTGNSGELMLSSSFQERPFIIYGQVGFYAENCSTTKNSQFAKTHPSFATFTPNYVLCEG